MIRAVLANLRCVIAFVSIAFALAVLAWNSYPFHPRQKLDWFFAALLVRWSVRSVPTPPDKRGKPLSATGHYACGFAVRRDLFLEIHPADMVDQTGDSVGVIPAAANLIDSQETQHPVTLRL